MHIAVADRWIVMTCCLTRAQDAYGDLFTHDYLENNVAGSNIEYGGFEPRLSKVNHHINDFLV